MKLYLNISIALLTISSFTFSQNRSSEKLKNDIKHNTEVVSKKAGKNVEYVAKESGKNIKKISEKTAIGVEKTVTKINSKNKKK